MAARQNLQDKIYTENPTAKVDLCFLQLFKRTFSSNVTHHTQSSFTAMKYSFRFPQKGQGGSVRQDSCSARKQQFGIQEIVFVVPFLSLPT